MATYEYTSSSGMPTVAHFGVMPEFRTHVTEYGSGKMVRNSKWTNPRYRFRIRYRTPMRESDITNIKDFFIARKGRFESFQLYAAPLGTTHTVMFVNDINEFDYFMAVLSETGDVEFIEEVA